MNIFLFDSHSLDALAEEFSRCLDRDIFSSKLILIPHMAMKEWLQLKLCGNGIVGLEFATPRQAVRKFVKNIPTRTDLAASLWHLAPTIEECRPFLASEHKALHFIDHLAAQFFEYSEYGLPNIDHWQKKLYEEIVQPISWDVPESPPALYLFGLDILPPDMLRYFLRFPSVQIFRFSPCAMFWEDFCSQGERKRILRKTAILAREPMNQLLRDAHPLLANWGKAMRKALPFYPEPAAENYEMEEPKTALHNLQLDLLLSEKREYPSDHSIRVLQTGSSRLQEVEILRREILALQIPFSDIRVYAPDIGPYVPLIEYCFADLPIRISDVDLVSKNPLYQALLHIFALVDGRWDEGPLLALFEMPVFYRKIPCSSEEVEKIARWIQEAHIRKEGLDRLLDSFLYLQPEKEFAIAWSDADLFERFYTTFDALTIKLASWKKERTLKEWADEIEQFPFLDMEDADQFSIFDGLRKASSDKTFPLSFVQKFFFTNRYSELGGSQLHAIRFAKLETILPARAIFVLGMDEESFPRRLTHTSLLADRDRSLFLSLIFASKEKLTFSYSHRSAEDGKPVSPSLLVQELLSYLGGREELVKMPKEVEKSFSLISNSSTLPPSIPLKQVSLRDLSLFLKNPFLHVMGMELREEIPSAWDDFALSSLDRYKMLRAFLEKEAIAETIFPPGLFGDLAKSNLEQEKAGFTRALQHWGIASVKSYKIDRIIGGVCVRGEAHFGTSTGALHMGSDTIESVLRRWAEILIVLTETGSKQLYCLKSERIRPVVDPQNALCTLLELYQRCQHSPLFLHPEWADSILRKGSIPEVPERRDLLWAIRRSPEYDLEKELFLWKETLQSSFSSLIALFPRRPNATV
jgi:exonuclease V gamma subunit